MLVQKVDLPVGAEPHQFGQRRGLGLAAVPSRRVLLQKRADQRMVVRPPLLQGDRQDDQSDGPNDHYCAPQHGAGPIAGGGHLQHRKAGCERRRSNDQHVTAAGKMVEVFPISYARPPVRRKRAIGRYASRWGSMLYVRCPATRLPEASGSAHWLPLPG